MTVVYRYNYGVIDFFKRLLDDRGALRLTPV